MADQARIGRVAERIKTTVARLVEKRLKDPRLGFITITDCKVTGDLQHATVYYTVMGSETEKKLSQRALNSAKGMVRSEVGRALGIRLTPSIEFAEDSLPETSASFEDTLAKALAADAQIKKQAENSSYAGEEDPYRKPREVEEVEFEQEGEEFEIFIPEEN